MDVIQQMLERDRQLDLLDDNEMFGLLVSNIQDYGLFMVDLKGLVMSWNDGAKLLTGFEHEEIVGKSAATLYAASVESAPEKQTQAFSDRREENGWCRRKDGCKFWANIVISPLKNRSGTIVAYSHSIRNLTEALEIQASKDNAMRAEAHESQFRNIADTSPNIVWSYDLSGQCVYVNPRWTEYTGQPLAKTLGNGWLDSIHPDDRQRTEAAWLEAIKNTSDFDTEYRLRDFNGAYKWFKSRAKRLEESNGRINGWVGACTDIDEQKRTADVLESAIQERTTELAQLNKDLQLARDRALEASALKSRFVANISHEIRTPMSGVLGMSELLLTCELEDEARELAQYIYTSARSLLDVVNDLLDFSKLEAGKLTITRMRFALSTVIEEAKQSTAVAASQKGLSYEVSVQEDLPDVYGDPVRIRQVLLNLIHNAIKFTSGGGIKIKLEETARTKNAVTVKFSIEDTGIGIAAESGKHLFNPFEQADGSTTRRYGGTGLGLSISKNLVKLMLGEIGFQSEEGKGSTFWFSMPLEIA